MQAVQPMGDYPLTFKSLASAISPPRLVHKLASHKHAGHATLPTPGAEGKLAA